MSGRLAGVLLLASLMLGMPASAGAFDDPPLEAWLGRYAMELRVASTMRLPLMRAERSVTTSLLLVDIEQGAGGLTQRHQVCDVRMEGSSSLLRTTVPEAFVRGLPSRQYPALLRPQSGGDGWLYRSDMGPEAIGFDPRLTGGGLPAGSGDQGVRDMDGDGNPGATIELRVPAFGRVRLFIAQHSHLLLHGRSAGPGRIGGEVEIRRLEQRTLGAEPRYFNRTPALQPDAARSSFTLVRLPADLDCAGLRAAAENLFP